MRLAVLVIGDRQIVAARGGDGFVELAGLGHRPELGAFLRTAPDFTAVAAEMERVGTLRNGGCPCHSSVDLLGFGDIIRALRRTTSIHRASSMTT